MEPEVQIRRIGLTLLHAADNGAGASPEANIVFVHGLGGHPQRTWEARVESPASGQKSPRQKSSLFNPRTWGYTPAATPEPVLSRSQTEQSTEFDVPIRQHSSVSASTSTSASVTSGQASIGGEARLSPRKAVHWPRDLLPLDIPQANIFVYGYNADIIGTLSDNGNTGLTLTQLAQNMLMDFDRELDDNIPIIPCAHSLGGILVKEVLWQSKTNVTESLRKVHRLTKCVLFFGTPHRGSRMAGWGEMTAKLVKLLYQGPLNHQVMRSLAPNSEVLDGIQNSFEKMIAAGDFYVHTFQEGRAVFKLGKVVEDYSSKLPGYPGLKWEVIDRDHRKMIQFEAKDDPGYRQACESLKGYMSHLTEADDAKRSSVMSVYSAFHLPSEIIFSVPYPRNKEFVARDDTIDTINKLFCGPSAMPFVVLCGLGGIGKTQIAVEVAHRSRDVKSVIWIHAGTRDRLDKSFRDALGCLDIQSSSNVDHLRVAESWLRNPKNGPWLMVVDNVDDVDVVFPEASQEEAAAHLISCIPDVSHGSVLFVTRWMAVAQKITKRGHVHLGEMTTDQGTELIHSYMGIQYDDGHETKENAKELLGELGHIPLAITHAAAFMREYAMDVSEYLELYRKSAADQEVLLEPAMTEMGVRDSNIAYSSDDFPVLNAWLTSFTHIQADKRTGPLAIDLLSIMSFLDGHDVPGHLFKDFRPRTPSAQYSRAFGTLRSFSMIQQRGSADRARFRVHRLIQLAMRRWLDQNGQGEKYARDALGMMSAKFPDDVAAQWKTCVELQPHAESVLGLTEIPPANPARMRLLRLVASFQSLGGQYAAARAKWEEVVELLTETVGAHDMQTLNARDEVALTLLSEAEFDKADRILGSVLEIKHKMLGDEDPDVLKTAYIRAVIVGQRGDHFEAEAQHRRIFEARRGLLGEKHTETLRSGGKLLLELWELGRFEEAETLGTQTVDACKVALGETHPETLDAADTLGFVLECRGRLLEAERLKNGILEKRKELYGPNHPSTADSEHDVAWVLHQLGRYEEAKPHYETALEKKRLLLGDDHWKTLTTRCNLPVFYCDTGDYEAAEEHSRKIILDFKRTRGEEHPQTLDATGGLAVILRHRGKLEEAARAARTSIDGRERVIGKDHPWTQPPLCHWGYVLSLQGELERGEGVMREALARMESTLGKDHGFVFTGLLQLCENLVLQGRDGALLEAGTLARRALRGREASLGPEHPYTFKARWKVARVLARLGTDGDAGGEMLALHRAARAGLVETLGSDHPDAERCGQELSQAGENRNSQ